MWVKLLKNVANANANANAIEANRPVSVGFQSDTLPRPPSMPSNGPAGRIFSYKLEFRLGPKLDRQTMGRGSESAHRTTRPPPPRDSYKCGRKCPKITRTNKPKTKTRMRALGTKRNGMKRMRP